MIAIVDIIAGRLMRDGLTRQLCQLVAIILGRIKSLPSGPTGSHLEEAETHV